MAIHGRSYVNPVIAKHGLISNDRAAVLSFAEVEVPDAAVTMPPRPGIVIATTPWERLFPRPVVNIHGPNVHRQAQVSFAELEVPDLVLPQTKIFTTTTPWFEVTRYQVIATHGLATPDRRALISFSELEVPDLVLPQTKIFDTEIPWSQVNKYQVISTRGKLINDRQALISFAEFEIADPVTILPPTKIFSTTIPWHEVTKYQVITAHGPNIARQALISFAELEVPDLVLPKTRVFGATTPWSQVNKYQVTTTHGLIEHRRRALLSFAEVEVPDAAGAFTAVAKTFIFQADVQLERRFPLKAVISHGLIEHRRQARLAYAEFQVPNVVGVDTPRVIFSVSFG